MANKNKLKWRTKRRIEELYNTLLGNLLKPIKNQVLRNANNLDKVKSILENASKSKTYLKKSDEIAKKIVTLTLEDNAKDWREAANKAGNPKLKKMLEKEMEGEIKKRYDELLERNAKIIKTLPENISKDVVKHISRKTWTGARTQEIAKEIREFFPRHIKAKEELIARTESAKCKTALTQARSEDIGVDWYIWRSMEDSNVRSAHNIMDGVIVNFNHSCSPEEMAKKAGRYKGKTYGRYGPGEIFNCRCYAEPLLQFTNTRWPANVYNWKTNRIEKMTLDEFKKFGGKEFEF